MLHCGIASGYQPANRPATRPGPSRAIYNLTGAEILINLKTVLGAIVVAVSVISAAPQGYAHDAAHGAAVPVAQIVTGSASWYGPKFHGRLTANGERFNMDELTAAHRTLPFGTRVRVTNQANGKSVIVRINDRGPFHGKRVIDLSRGAARSIGLMSRGVGNVKLEVLESV